MNSNIRFISKKGLNAWLKDGDSIPENPKNERDQKTFNDSFVSWELTRLNEEAW
jgi:hypothetical protein